MDSASNSNMRPLFLLQITAMRIITFSNKRTRATPLFSRLQILKPARYFSLELAKLMHKVHKKALSICSASTNNYAIGYYVITSIHTTPEKNIKKNYFITRVSSKQAQKCLQCNGPKIWNETPLQIKQKNFGKFKIEFKRKLISAYYYLSFGG